MKSLNDILNECLPEVSEDTKELIYPLVVANILSKLLWENCEEVGIDDRGIVYFNFN